MRSERRAGEDAAEDVDDEGDRRAFRTAERQHRPRERPFRIRRRISVRIDGPAVRNRSPVCAATMILPRATTLVDASKISGGSCPAGMPTATGLVPRKRVRPPKGAMFGGALEIASPMHPAAMRLFHVVGGRTEMIAVPRRRRTRPVRLRQIERRPASLRAPTTGPSPLSPSTMPPRFPLACTRMSGRALTTPACTRRAYTGSRTIPWESTPRSSALIRQRRNFAGVVHGNVQSLEHAAAESNSSS